MSCCVCVLVLLCLVFLLIVLFWVISWCRLYMFLCLVFGVSNLIVLLLFAVGLIAWLGAGGSACWFLLDCVCIYLLVVVVWYAVWWGLLDFAFVVAVCFGFRVLLLVLV